MSDSTPTLVWTSTRTASWWQLPRQGEKAKSGSGAWSGTRLPLQECEDDTQIFGRRLRARMARNTMVALALVDISPASGAQALMAMAHPCRSPPWGAI